ncbi:MAG: hypothetical protein GXP43_00485 [bacterium]|nr:hypothetical protein [bacterium]
MDKFAQGKKMMKMAQQAKALERELEQEEVEAEKGGIKVLVSGTLKIKEIWMDGEEQELLREVINEALKKAQKKAAKRAMALGSMFGM